jgi:hypothetical protein
MDGVSNRPLKSLTENKQKADSSAKEDVSNRKPFFHSETEMVSMKVSKIGG